MVFRCYTEKRPGFDVEARLLMDELRNALGISGVERVRIINRYDVEGISRDVYEHARSIVFSEPQVDVCFDEEMPDTGGDWVLAVEALPGQYDQRADSCAQCIQLLAGGERPVVAAAKIYAIGGRLSEKDKEAVRRHLINPVECREASLEKPSTLARTYDSPPPVKTIEGFRFADEAGLERILKEYGLAMDIEDLRFMRDWFRDREGRDPTEAELKITDTYWSDHCRHTTFNTRLDRVVIEDEAVAAAYEEYLKVRREVYGENEKNRPQTLMDMGTLAAKALKKRGKLRELDESEEINACSIRVEANVDGEKQDWLLMFKNETHNHPTEIEPFGGAATCIGGAIRDPLSGRAYVYQSMRVTGAGDPTVPIEDTLPGKLPQRRLVTTAAAGYSSYGNQIGLATGLVHEFYHPGYVAKRLEAGAVVGAAPAENVVRRTPEPGDVVLLVGGRTGRDGIGGATGSSKAHNMESLSTMASEVQKGNAPEERKIQRLFRKPHVARMIKRCNDFGAGGVSVAVGELADGVDIDLDRVRKKYEGLSGTEIAISESQERMAVVVSAENAERFIAEAGAENLEAYEIARITDKGRMTMRHEGVVIADLSREFLSTNGAPKHAEAFVPPLGEPRGPEYSGTYMDRLKSLLSDLRFCSRRGLAQRFDSTVGAGTVLMPYGGRRQASPSQVMAALLPAEKGETTTCSVMSFGFDPCASEANPFVGAKQAVVSSVAKLVAAGCDPEKAYLSFQEYFERLGRDPRRWGKPLSALLGAFTAQMELEAAAIGGKDSMSGSFMDMDVPPTLISFAVAPCEAENIISTEFKAAGSLVYLFPPGENIAETRRAWRNFRDAAEKDAVLSAWAVTEGGCAEGLFKMAVGNEIGFKTCDGLDPEMLFKPCVGGIIAESARPLAGAILLGETISEPVIVIGGEKAAISDLRRSWEAVLEGVFPTKAGSSEPVPAVTHAKPCVLVAKSRYARPKAVIPVFPGTNCEYDTARAVERAGGQAEIVVINNLSQEYLADSVKRLEKAIRSAQMLILPGGFSGGDEPDGSGKFIASFFRNPALTDAVHELLKNRDGLVLGICNGFQALIKLGLLPYGEIRPMDENCPTLTFNLIGRHQSGYVTTRVCSVMSPWLSKCKVGELYTIPVSHGEGRFVASREMLDSLISNGQIATQYTDLDGRPTMDIEYNPNGSVLAVEGITSPDGRVLGKMGHTERRGRYVAVNIPGNKWQPIFESGVEYYK